MTIQCTNPTCKTHIPVPEGATYVVCQVCNTWHFPSDFADARENPVMPGNIDYGVPPVDTAPPPSPPPVVPPPAEFPSDNPYPQYKAEESSIPNYAPTFHKPELTVVKKEVSTVGWLLLPDDTKLQLKPGKNIIGRTCGDLSINDTTVSRKHCVIDVTPNPSGNGWEYLLYDIGAIEPKSSTNGVFFSGRSLRLQNNERIPVYNGTIIKLGTVRVVLQFPV